MSAVPPPTELDSTDNTGSDQSSALTAFGHAIGAAWALLVGVGLLMLGTGLQGSLLGLRANIEGFDTTTTGVVMSSYYLGYILGSARAPRLVATVGHIRVFAALASLASVAVLMHSVAVEPLGWVAFRITSGFCIAGLFIVAESWLNDSATNETRGSLLSIYMVVVSGSTAAGQLLLNVADPGSHELFVLSSVLVSVALVPAALSVRANPRFLQPTPVRLVEVWRAVPLGIVGSALAGLASGALMGMGVIYAQLVGLDLAETSKFMLVAILGGTVAQFPLGALSDRIDRRLVISGAATVAAVAALVGTVGPTGLVLFVVIGVVGACSMPLYALLNAHTNDWIEHDQMVGAGSRLVLASGIGALGGPFLASTAMNQIGAAGFFWLLVFAHGAIAFYALWRVTRRTMPVDEQSHFATIPDQAGALVATLNPEAYDEDDEPIFPTEELPVIEIEE